MTMVAHATWSVWYTAQQRSSGFRTSFRIAVGTMLLVWFAYFANRPEPGYLCSYLLLYGLLLIDLGRYMGLGFQAAAHSSWIRAVLGVLVLCHAGFVASRVIEWSWNPSQWTVRCLRWGVPLVRRGRDQVSKPTEDQ